MWVEVDVSSMLYVCCVRRTSGFPGVCVRSFRPFGSSLCVLPPPCGSVGPCLALEAVAVLHVWRCATHVCGVCVGGVGGVGGCMCLCLCACACV